LAHVLGVHGGFGYEVGSHPLHFGIHARPLADATPWGGHWCREFHHGPRDAAHPHLAAVVFVLPQHVHHRREVVIVPTVNHGLRVGEVHARVEQAELGSFRPLGHTKCVYDVTEPARLLLALQQFLLEPFPLHPVFNPFPHGLVWVYGTFREFRFRVTHDDVLGFTQDQVTQHFHQHHGVAVLTELVRGRCGNLWPLPESA